MLKPGRFVLPLLSRFIGSAETESTGRPLDEAWKPTHERAHLSRARQLDRLTEPTRHALLDLSSRQALIVSELGQYLGNAALESTIWLHLCNCVGQRCERVRRNVCLPLQQLTDGSKSVDPRSRRPLPRRYQNTPPARTSHGTHFGTLNIPAAPRATPSTAHTTPPAM